MFILENSNYFSAQIFNCLSSLIRWRSICGFESVDGPYIALLQLLRIIICPFNTPSKYLLRLPSVHQARIEPIGVSESNVSHCTWYSGYTPDLAAYLDKFLLGKTADTKFLRTKFTSVDTTKWLPWTTPENESKWGQYRPPHLYY